MNTAISVDDKYTAASGLAYMNGTHALVRLPMLQRERDAAAGLDTAAFISSYRGLPLGGYDQALQKAKQHLDRHHVSFVPGVNEALAATAVWGNHGQAIALAVLPEQVRGFGHVKEKAIAKMRAEQARLLALFDAAPMPEEREAA